jgi:hypothetical protein
VDRPRRRRTTEIYAQYAPDPTGGAAFAERAFGLGGPSAAGDTDAVPIRGDSSERPYHNVDGRWTGRRRPG